MRSVEYYHNQVVKATTMRERRWQLPLTKSSEEAERWGRDGLSLSDRDRSIQRLIDQELGSLEGEMRLCLEPPVFRLYEDDLARETKRVADLFLERSLRACTFTERDGEFHSPNADWKMPFIVGRSTWFTPWMILDHDTDLGLCVDGLDVWDLSLGLSCHFIPCSYPSPEGWWRTSALAELAAEHAKGPAP